MQARKAKIQITLLSLVFVGILQAGCGSVSIPVPDKPNEPPPAHRELIRQALQGRIELPDADNFSKRGVGQDNPTVDETAAASPTTVKRFNKEMVAELSDLNVSRPELELSHVGWAWKSCLKARYKGSIVTIAFFMRSNRILDIRINVEADCNQQEYEPLDGGLPQVKRKSTGR